jgi:aryl carrier-like protein
VVCATYVRQHRCARLVDAWREAGVEVSFVDLAEEPTIAHWRTLLTAQLS